VGCGPQEEFRSCADVAIGGRLIVSTTSRTPTTESPTDNEVSEHAPEEGPEAEGGAWWLTLAILLGSLVCVVSGLGLLYWYYYHARDSLKHLLKGRKSQQEAQQAASPAHEPPPVPPRRNKKPYNESGLV
jgi:hypothetical protein